MCINSARNIFNFLSLTRIRLPLSRLTIFGLGLNRPANITCVMVFILPVVQALPLRIRINLTAALRLCRCRQKCIWTHTPQSTSATTRMSDFVIRCSRFGRLYRWQIRSRMRRTCSCNDARAVHARHVCALYRVFATFADFVRRGVNCLTKGTE